MQCFEVISISGGYPAMLPPFGLVLGLSMLKDAYEDYKRYKADQKDNEATAEVFNIKTKQFEMTSWSKIKVG